MRHCQPEPKLRPLAKRSPPIFREAITVRTRTTRCTYINKDRIYQTANGTLFINFVNGHVESYKMDLVLTVLLNNVIPIKMFNITITVNNFIGFPPHIKYTIGVLGAPIAAHDIDHIVPILVGFFEKMKSL